MRSGFGTEVQRLVFSPGCPQYLRLLERAVQDAVKNWEPRVDVDQVAAEADPVEPFKVVVSITYTVRQTNTTSNLVFPYYLGTTQAARCPSHRSPSIRSLHSPSPPHPAHRPLLCASVAMSFLWRWSRTEPPWARWTTPTTCARATLSRCFPPERTQVKSPSPSIPTARSRRRCSVNSALWGLCLRRRQALSRHNGRRRQSPAFQRRRP